MNQYLLFNS